VGGPQSAGEIRGPPAVNVHTPAAFCFCGLRGRVGAGVGGGAKVASVSAPRVPLYDACGSSRDEQGPRK
jgi:hypothetical protein